MKKAIAPTTFVFKGSGWAKKDRRATASPAKPAGVDPASGGSDKATGSTPATASDGGPGASPGASASESSSASPESPTAKGGD